MVPLTSALFKAPSTVNLIAQRIKGIIFLGTYYGSKIAMWGEVVTRIYSLVPKTNQNTLNNLKLNSKALKDLQFSFPDIIRKRNQTSIKVAVIFFFFKKMTYKVVYIKLQTPTNSRC
jgi:hypothetical protein